MGDRLGRREFCRSAALGTLSSLAGCSLSQSSDSTPTPILTAPPTGTGRGHRTSEAGGSDEPPSLSGTAVALSGEPIAGGSVRAVVPGEGTVAETTTEGAGAFGLDTAGEPAWLQVEAEGFHGRTVAVAPDSRPTVELTPREGTVSLRFCGDVMFGRRFYGTTGEPGPRVRISPATRLADHRAILEPVAPLLRGADVTSINLESPLTTTNWRHPEKVFTFVSHPVAARALAGAGVDYCALGNNHTLDALVPGLEDTFVALDSAGLAYSGAGRSAEEAWGPAGLDRRGITVGFLSCTTVVEPQHDIDLSADRGADRTHTVGRDTDSGRTTMTFSGDVGAAEATERRLDRRVASTSDRTDVTVVQIHGGYDYRRRSIAKIRGLADAAIAAGADVVVCHHPHVTGGLERRDGALVAWSLGNFVFDQTRWETFPSYVLTAHVGHDGVERAYVDPVVLDGYVPTGVVGEPRASQLRRTAGLSGREFELGGRTLQFVRDRSRTIRTATRTFDGSAIHARVQGWPRGVLDGGDALQFGRDRLPTGRFDDPAVGAVAREPLWRVETGSTVDPAAVEYGSNGAVGLVRDGTDDEPAVLGPVAPVPVSGSLTLAGRYRTRARKGIAIRVSWYEAIGDPPVGESHIPLEKSTGEWTWMREGLRVPRSASHVDVAVEVSTPAAGERTVDIDDLRLVEWAPAATGGRAYDHIRVDGRATVAFATLDAPGAAGEIRWPPLGD